MALLLLALWFTHRKPLFTDPLSAVLKDRNGMLMGARIAADGQWRFATASELPEKYMDAVLTYEDSRFFIHPGIDPFSMLRAFVSNIKAGKVVRGGSTITMQVIRLSRKGKHRSIGEKIIEMWQALALELRLSKSSILILYASNAPFGGNVVGLEAASWRWFGRPPDDLSWAEAATLAVLPNAPSMISVQRNRDALLKKRNRLLLRLHQRSLIDQLTYELAVAEPLPDEPIPLPDLAPHYLEYLRKTKGDGLFVSQLSSSLQSRIRDILQSHHQVLSGNDIQHMAVVVREVKNARVIAYHGNIPASAVHNEGVFNDMVQSYRSSGSILKPFLYAAALDAGLIHPHSLLPDIPTWLSGFHPTNFDERYAGAVDASVALQRSLNVPFVHLLHRYGHPLFHQLLQKLGFRGFSKPSSHYGLSIILGGGEVSLWELSEVYARWAAELSDVPIQSGFPLSKGSLFLTAEALKKLNRPETESGWHFKENAFNMAWKTGTSYGFRDAWAVGFTPTHCIAVWVGNADGHGRPGLTGISAAAPILFDVAMQLPTNEWFLPPGEQLTEYELCTNSGYPAGPFCTEKQVQTTLLHQAGTVMSCPWHQMVRIDPSGSYRVPDGCGTVQNTQAVSWFVLPPLMEHYYRQQHADYIPLPPPFRNCSENTTDMEFVYPPPDATIFQPRTYNGQLNPFVFELIHRQPKTKVFWHLDQKFIGQTSGFVHQMVVNDLREGLHQLSAMDETGHSIVRTFKLMKR